MYPRGRKLEREVLRSLVINYLTKVNEEGRSDQAIGLPDFVTGVERIALESGLIERTQNYTSSSTSATHYLPMGDHDVIGQIVFDLVIEGIIAPQRGLGGLRLDWFVITEVGLEALSSGQPMPYDPDGYIKYLGEYVVGLDPTILEYVTESLLAFTRGALRASTVMLGVASEKALLLLIDAYTNAITDQNKQTRFKKKVDESISLKSKFGAFRKAIDPIRKQLKTDISDDIDLQLDATFNLIRIHRNEAGHPTGVKVQRNQVFGYLQLFPDYCKRIYELMEYFGAHRI